MKRRAEDVAAVLNGSLVLLVPMFFLVFGTYLFDSNTDNSVIVRPPGVWHRVRESLRVLWDVGPYLAPFALLAGWRTWVHGKQWREGVGTGWWGVAEAGATGFAIAIITLTPGIVTRPTEAPPYILVYGGAALIIGLIVGLLLRTTALILLKLLRTAAPAHH